MNLLEDIKNPLWKEKNVIYCYTNKINGKKYIGQTTQMLKTRHKQHMYEVNNIGHGFKYHLHSSIRTYGIENFTLEILHIADEYSLDLLEIYYIEKWNLLNHEYGYNCCIGGSDGDGKNSFTNQSNTNKLTNKCFDEKRKREYSERMKGKNNPMYGIRQCGKNNGRAKKIAQYNLNGNLIYIWDCINEACDYLNITRGTFRMYLKGKNNHEYNGYVWKYYEEVK